MKEIRIIVTVVLPEEITKKEDFIPSEDMIPLSEVTHNEKLADMLRKIALCKHFPKG